MLNLSGAQLRFLVPTEALDATGDNEAPDQHLLRFDYDKTTIRRIRR